MAKKKTDNKELKLEKTEKKVKDIEMPDTPMVRILLHKDNKEYTVGRDNAIILVNSNRAELV